MDLRPELDDVFGIFDDDPATVTVPGGLPIETTVVKQQAFNEPFPNDTGNHSLTKGRLRISLRLDHLGVAKVELGTTIVIGADTYDVEATDYLDDQIAHCLVRLVVP